MLLIYNKNNDLNSMKCKIKQCVEKDIYYMQIIYDVFIY